MVNVQSKLYGSITGARWFTITGESSGEVQRAINSVINWIGFLNGVNTAEFENPKRRGDVYVAEGYTLIDNMNSYETLRFD